MESNHQSQIIPFQSEVYLKVMGDLSHPATSPTRRYEWDYINKCSKDSHLLYVSWDNLIETGTIGILSQGEGSGKSEWVGYWLEVSKGVARNLHSQYGTVKQFFPDFPEDKIEAKIATDTLEGLYESITHKEECPTLKSVTAGSKSALVSAMNQVLIKDGEGFSFDSTITKYALPSKPDISQQIQGLIIRRYLGQGEDFRVTTSCWYFLRNRSHWFNAKDEFPNCEETLILTRTRTKQDRSVLFMPDFKSGNSAREKQLEEDLST